MEVGEAVAALVAIAAPTAYVLRDLAPPRPPRADPGTPAEPAPELVAGPVLGVGRVPVAEPVGPADVDGSMLAGITQTEADERSFVRRVVSLAVLLGLTVGTAALVGAGIYRAVSGLG